MQGIKKTFNRFSLDQKVFTLIVIEVVGFCFVALVAISQLRHVGDQVDRIAEVTLPLHLSIENIRSQILNQRLSTKEIIIGATQTADGNHIDTINPGVRSGYLDSGKEIQKSIESTEKFIRKSVVQQDANENILSLNSEDLLQALFSLRRATQIYDRLVRNLLQQIEDRSFSMELEILEHIRSSEMTLMDKLADLTARLEIIRQESIRHAVYVKRIATGFIILTLLAAVIFFIAMLLLIIRKNISRPLQLLTDTINAFTAMFQVEESEFEKGLMARRDELGRMGRSFNRLKHDLWRQGQDLRDAKEEAEQANRAKSMFLAAASHDLRQPLHAMQMYITALRQKTVDQESLAIVDDIDAVSISTARLLSALLDVSQLEAGAIEPSYKDFPVMELLGRVFREFAPAAKQKKLDFRLIPSSASVRSDPVLLERILGNFMSNAIRYTRQGRILIGVRRRGSSISIEVWDTGWGIPDDQTLAIFEDFHQIHNEERDRSKGLGLGLAIAKRLAACLSHEIECDSMVGSGSRFAVLVAGGKNLPGQAAETGILENLIHGLSGRRVLLIEDDMEVLKATRQLLESWGCHVVTGRNMDEVIDIVGEQSTKPPDIIVADNRLPGGTQGVEVASRVQLMIGHAIPTVIVTGDVQESHIRDIANQGYQVMCKPVQPARLRALISHMTAPGPGSQADSTGMS